jgi:hypothetical protein
MTMPFAGCCNTAPREGGSERGSALHTVARFLCFFALLKEISFVQKIPHDLRVRKQQKRDMGFSRAGQTSGSNADTRLKHFPYNRIADAMILLAIVPLEETTVWCSMIRSSSTKACLRALLSTSQTSRW